MTAIKIYLDLAAEVERLTAERDGLLAVLKLTRGNIASLGPAGALEPFAPYREWLAQVDAAIAAAEKGNK